MRHLEDYKFDWSQLDAEIKRRLAKPKDVDADCDQPIIHADIGFGTDTGE